jgi:hypothetical protein
MKQFIISVILVFSSIFTITAQTQTFTVASDSTNATFSYNLDASHSYTFTISGYYKTPQVYIRPAFNPDNAYFANWVGTIYPWSGANYPKNWTNVQANQTFFEVPNLPSPTRKKQTLNVWTPYSCEFTISNISASGTYPLYLNTNMGIPVGLTWKAGTTVTITQN